MYTPARHTRNVSKVGTLLSCHDNKHKLWMFNILNLQDLHRSYIMLMMRIIEEEHFHSSILKHIETY